MQAGRLFFAAVGYSVLLTTAGPLSAADCGRPTVADVESLHDRWAQSLATMHPDKVLKNYAPDATLIGLDSPELHSDFLAIRNHYVYFLQREAKMRIESRIIRITCETASDVGTMTLSARPSSKAPHLPLSVRYSINYERRDDRWLIVHHHLSITEDPAVAGSGSVSAAPVPRTPEVAGFVKRLPPAKARPTPPAPAAASPQTEQLVGGWTYTPGVWRNGVPTYQGD